MLRIGLTGGIGSGKSTVSRMFAELGVPVIDADVIARDLVAPGQPLLDEIQGAFGAEVVRDGVLDREQLRTLVFASAELRARLEAILHPAIRHQIAAQVAALNAPYSVLVIPLLVEKGWRQEVDRILVVDADPQLQLTRTTQRDGLSPAQVEAIMATQASREERLKMADDVIVNDGELNPLRHTVALLHQRYLELAGTLG